MKGNTEKFSDILKDYVFERKKVNPNISESQISRSLGVFSSHFLPNAKLQCLSKCS